MVPIVLLLIILANTPTDSFVLLGGPNTKLNTIADVQAHIYGTAYIHYWCDIITVHGEVAWSQNSQFCGQKSGVCQDSVVQAKTMVKTQDAGLACDFGAVIQALAFTPGWNEKNFQVSQRDSHTPLVGRPFA